MLNIKVILLLALNIKFTFAVDLIDLYNVMYNIETNCCKDTVTIDILVNGKFVFSDLVSDARIKCPVLRKVKIMGEVTRDNITLEIDRAVFRDNQTYVLIENIHDVTFLNKSLIGHVNVIFQSCSNVYFDETSLEDAAFVEMHLYESNLMMSGAFGVFDKFIVVDHGSESSTTNSYDWITNNETSKTMIIAGNSTPTHMISNLYSQYQVQERNKCVGIYLSIPVFCILIICLAIIGISLIWTKWILESERRLLRWYVANTVGDEEEFIEEHVLLRNGNVIKSGIH